MIKIFSFIIVIITVGVFIVPQHSQEMVLSAFSNLMQTQPPAVSLDSIFSDNKDWKRALPKDRLRTIVATGDIIPARSVNYQTTIRNNFLWPYEHTASLLQDADITFVNLEAPLLLECPVTNEGMIFCGNAKHIDGLVHAGVDMVTIANNHAGNYGKKGIEETIQLLEKHAVSVTGIQGPVYQQIRGVTFAFLGYNDIGTRVPGISHVDETRMVTEIQEAQQKADVVLVAMHWGAEYRSQPDARQQYLARLVIDAGADLIIGNHPHWIQPVDIYKDKLITYAHGNFIFDQEWSLKTKQGVVGKYTFLDMKLIDVEFFPVQIEQYGQPTLLFGEKRRNVLKDMEQESSRLQQ